MNDLISLAWIGICTALVFFMQAGFALLECGLVRAKNSVNVILKNYANTCVVGIAFWIVGNGMVFGTSLGGWMGASGYWPDKLDSAAAINLLYQTMFASAAAAIVSGAVAERIRFSAYLTAAVVIGAVIYPVFGHWAWNPNGWLKTIGFVDFAGGSVVHSMGAWCSLAAIIALGPRLGRFGKNGEARDIPGHNLPMVTLGGFILWLGWFGFNGGSVPDFGTSNTGIVLLNTHLGGCVGAVGAMVFQRLTRRPILMTTTINASLCGMVAVTGGALFLTPMTAAFTALVAGMLSILGAELLRRFQIDDAVDAIAVHGMGGVWGTIAVGLFYNGDMFSSQRLMIQLLGVAACFAWTFPVAFLTFKVLDRALGIRSSSLNEQRGLDYTEHAELGYPEFQKSPAQLKMEG